MASKKRSRNLHFFISVMLTAFILACGLIGVESVHPRMLVSGLALPLARLMGFILLGLAAGQMIEASGWTKHVANLCGPLFRFARLGPRCGAAFVTAFFSGAAANAMLYDFFQEGKISKFQLILSNLVNQFPAYFLHLPTTVFIVLPLTGRAGALYFLLTFLAAVLRTVFFLSIGHLFLEDCAWQTDNDLKTGLKKNGLHWSTLRQTFSRRLGNRIVGIATYVVPVYCFVFIVNKAGFFKAAQTFLAQFVVTSFIPVESLSFIVISFAAEFTSGFAAAGALMDAGVISVKQTVAALIIGNIVAFPIRALRHQLPRYAGIFNPKLGSQILFLGQGFRVFSLILVLTGYYSVT
ncbi:MAG: nucleoside recognition protein [Desulfobacteraceae bacterium]|nr:nucleoside recognition protein [Desulfobacteraceae bacterium]